jgi:tetratricopeptide (TPR) repeat protein
MRKGAAAFSLLVAALLLWGTGCAPLFPLAPTASASRGIEETPLGHLSPGVSSAGRGESPQAILHFLEGYLYELENDTGKASASYERAVQADPESAILREALASALLRRGALERALLEAEAAVRLAPDHLASRMLLGGIYAGLRRREEAIAQYHKAIELDPRGSIARNNLGVLYDKKGLYEEAIREFETVLQIDPGSANGRKNLETAKKNLAVIQEREKQIAQAIKDVEGHPESPNASYKLARLYAHYGKKEQAIEWLDKALKLGFSDFAYLRVDAAMESLRDDPNYIWLLRGR